MKRIASFIVCSVAALLTSCNINVDMQNNNKQDFDPTAIGFGVYMNRGVTTKAGYAGELTTDTLKKATVGFGVFSYYGNGAMYNETMKPDFMYNQWVKFTGNNVWEYSPIKYWPNEFGQAAGNEAADRLTFFAYAPYVEVTPSTGIVTGDDEYGILGMTRNISAGDPQVMYGARLQPGGGVDLCWGVAANDFTSSVDGNNNKVDKGKPFINLIKPKTGDKISFEFNHALSQLNVQIDADIDVESHAASSLDSKTRIYVRSVTFTGFALRGSLNLNSEAGKPVWSDISGTGRLRRDPVTIYDGRSDGLEGIATAVDLNETPATLSPMIIQSSPFDIQNMDGVTNTTVNLFSYADPTNPVAAVNDPIMVIPIAGVPLTVTIVYDIETKDPNLAGYLSDGVTRGISIENKITKSIQLNDGSNMTLEAGKKYVIGLHLGLTSVKFDAQVANWDNEQHEGSAYLPVNTTIPTWDGTTEALTETPDGNYVIKNAAQLAQLAVDVNNGNTYAGKTITLMSDIDLNNLPWTPIGMSGSDAASDEVEAYVFCGTFDGNNKTIHNLKVEQTGERGFAGLFGDIQSDNEVTIKDLTIKNVDIQGNHMAAGLLGRYVGLNNTGKLIVNNVTVSGGTITSTPWDNNGTAESGNQVGGIIGNGYWSGINIDNCAVRGVTITGARDLGGIAGALGTPESFMNNTVENSIIQQKYPSNIENKNLTTVHEIVGRKNSSDWPIDASNIATNVTVKRITISTVTVSLANNTVWLGETVSNPSVTTKMTNDMTVKGTTVWSSSDTRVATIDSETGEITLVGPGTTTIKATVTFGGETMEGSADLSINAVSAVSISPATATVNLGGSLDVKATLTMTNFGTITELPVVTWSRTKVSISSTSTTATEIGGVVSATVTASVASTITEPGGAVRAHVANRYTGIGDIESGRCAITFADPTPTAPDGTSGGLFSVSDTKQVYIATSNLMWEGTTLNGSYRLMENPWTTVEVNGDDCSMPENYGISEINSVQVSLYGWGTPDKPYLTSDSDDAYAVGGYVDWGTMYGDKKWRCLTGEEWEYVLNRNVGTFGKGYAFATVNDVHGLILIPDDFSTPSGMTFYAGLDNGFNTNVFSDSEWAKLQKEGAVFLPAAGYRDSGSERVDNVGDVIYYWSSSSSTASVAVALYYDGALGENLYVDEEYQYRSYGYSVRLVYEK